MKKKKKKKKKKNKQDKTTSITLRVWNTCTHNRVQSATQNNKQSFLPRTIAAGNHLDAIVSLAQYQLLLFLLLRVPVVIPVQGKYPQLRMPTAATKRTTLCTPVASTPDFGCVAKYHQNQTEHTCSLAYLLPRPLSPFRSLEHFRR